MATLGGNVVKKIIRKGDPRSSEGSRRLPYVAPGTPFSDTRSSLAWIIPVPLQYIPPPCSVRQRKRSSLAPDSTSDACLDRRLAPPLAEQGSNVTAVGPGIMAYTIHSPGRRRSQTSRSSGAIRNVYPAAVGKQGVPQRGPDWEMLEIIGDDCATPGHCRVGSPV